MLLISPKRDKFFFKDCLTRFKKRGIFVAQDKLELIMRVSIIGSKSEISAVSVELRQMGAIFDKLSKCWKIDQHLIYDALSLIERGPSAALRNVLSVEKGATQAKPSLSASEISSAISAYCAESGLQRGCTLQSWQLDKSREI